MEKAVLFVDGENLRHYVDWVLRKEKLNGTDISDLDFEGLFSKILPKIELFRKVYYSAKLHEYKETADRSRALIAKQRFLKVVLEKQGFEFVISGHVRGQKVDGKVVFREKGVDVRIATDLLISAYEGKAKTVVLCSSDSDLQPAIKAAREKGLEIIYLGFEINPNKGLIYTTNRAVLIRNSEIVDFCKSDVKS